MLYVFWLNCNTMPFLHEAVNYVWCGMWLAVLYMSCIYTAIAFSPYNEDIDFLDFMTNVVGLAPLGLLPRAHHRQVPSSAGRSRCRARPAAPLAQVQRPVQG